MILSLFPLNSLQLLNQYRMYQILNRYSSYMRLELLHSPLSPSNSLVHLLSPLLSSPSLLVVSLSLLSLSILNTLPPLLFSQMILLRLSNSLLLLSESLVLNKLIQTIPLSHSSLLTSLSFLSHPPHPLILPPSILRPFRSHSLIYQLTLPLSPTAQTPTLSKEVHSAFLSPPRVCCSYTPSQQSFALHGPI